MSPEDFAFVANVGAGTGSRPWFFLGLIEFCRAHGLHDVDDVQIARGTGGASFTGAWVLDDVWVTPPVRCAVSLRGVKKLPPSSSRPACTALLFSYAAFALDAPTLLAHSHELGDVSATATAFLPRSAGALVVLDDATVTRLRAVARKTAPLPVARS